MASDPHDYLPPRFSRQGKKPHACVVTIFGASGDLTKRKLIPALYNLALEKRLPERFAVVGYARSEMTHEAFREKMREAVERIFPHRPERRSGVAAVRQYAVLRARRLRGATTATRAQESSSTTSTTAAGCLPARVFYLATPPDLYGTVDRAHRRRWVWRRRKPTASRAARVVIEKPFGTDLANRPRAQSPSARGAR